MVAWAAAAAALVLAAGGSVLASPSAAGPVRLAAGAAAPGSATTPSATPPDAGDPAEGNPDTDAAEEGRDPLEVVMDRLSPGVVPTRGRLTVTGQIRNRSDATRTDLQVYLLTSSEPMTTTDELQAGLSTAPDAEVGSRIIEPGLFLVLDDLDPDATTRFRLSVPVDQLGLSGAPGVYWVGVQVVGTEAGARAVVGRTRSLLPLVPAGTPATPVAVGLQLRNHTVRAADGSLEFLPGWKRTLAPGGRLRRLVALSGSTAGFPLAWVTDPALVDAARSVARGNPALDLAAAPDPGTGTGGGGGSGSGSDATDAATDAATEGAEPGAQDGSSAGSPGGRRARAWLGQFTTEAPDHPVLALPYADLDVSAAYRHGAEELVADAQAASAETLGSLGLSSSPVVAPPSGRISADAAAALDPDVAVVLSPDAVPAPGTAAVLDRDTGGRILVTPTAEGLRGPRPGAPRGALAVRQRLLADAALHALSPESAEPLVRLLPAGWDPGARWQRADFFAGLAVPWVTGTDLASVLRAQSSAEPVSADDLDYPDTELSSEVPFSVFAAARALDASGGTLAALLTDNDTIDAELTRQGLLAPSVWSRRRPGLAAERARGTAAIVDGWLSQVTVRSASFITTSDESGTFDVTLVNGLDQPVTVGLRATAPGATLALETPGAVDLAPGGRSAIRINARSTDIGIHLVTLQPVTADGVAVGQPSTLSIRSSRVGFILWVVMGVGGGLLLVLVVVRIWRRVQQRRATHGPRLRAVR